MKDRISSLPSAPTEVSGASTQQPGTPAPGGAAAVAWLDRVAEQTGAPAQPALSEGGVVPAQPVVPTTTTQEPGTSGRHPKR